MEGNLLDNSPKIGLDLPPFFRIDQPEQSTSQQSASPRCREATPRLRHAHSFPLRLRFPQTFASWFIMDPLLSFTFDLLLNIIVLLYVNIP